ncbi:hypothetical protein [Mycobacterium aquaticum]|uniref:hypothetical protein n=1 Tax=Mycobacterium aquaticum TaxID=1927124 RepID=UPI0011548A92|nr:hypothetical protein [Mycobacterium aquaticum]
MAWTKIPAAAASIACAACIAAATAVPGAEMQAAHLAKAVSGDVQFTALEDVLTDVLTATLQLDSLNGIAPLLNFATGGSGDPFSAFVPGIEPGWPGYAALSALWFYQNTFTGSTTYAGIEGISAFSGIPGYLNALGGDFTGVSVFDGITSFQNFPEEGLKAFVPLEDDPNTENVNEYQAGYAALSGLYFYKNFVANGFDTSADGLGGIDAFSALPLYKDVIAGDEETRDKALRGLDSVSAVPEYKTLFSRDATVGQRADALRSLDAFSAIPVYLGLPTAAEEEAVDPNVLAKTNIQTASEKTEVSSSEAESKLSKPSNPVTALSSVTPPSAEASDSGVPAAAPAAPEAPAAPAGSSSTSTKQSNGSYSGVFKPNNPVVLFGTGKGGGADNGIRGWDKVANGIRGALGLPKDNSGSSDSGSSGGE